MALINPQPPLPHHVQRQRIVQLLSTDLNPLSALFQVPSQRVGYYCQSLCPTTTGGTVDQLFSHPSRILAKGMCFQGWYLERGYS
jgi:hypothetical protein